MISCSSVAAVPVTVYEEAVLQRACPGPQRRAQSCLPYRQTARPRHLYSSSCPACGTTWAEVGAAVVLGPSGSSSGRADWVYPSVRYHPCSRAQFEQAGAFAYGPQSSLSVFGREGMLMLRAVCLVARIVSLEIVIGLRMCALPGESPGDGLGRCAGHPSNHMYRCMISRINLLWFIFWRTQPISKRHCIQGDSTEQYNKVIAACTISAC